ncbi:MAG: hypothetical protein MUF84_04805 [Anaerolineae bacterium]|nr:hypothetical protein [Anaerolineae bacterium]
MSPKPAQREGALDPAARGLLPWALLLVLLVLVGGGNVIRGVTGWIASSSLAVNPIPLPVLSTFYLVWGGVFLALGIAVYRGMGRHGHRVVVAVAVAYQTLVWIIRVVGERSSYARSLWLRELLFTGLFLLTVVLLARAATRRTGRGDRESQH